MKKSIKYILLIGTLISFSGTKLIAQSPKDNSKFKKKIVKVALYKAENGKLKNRDSILTSNIDKYIVFDKNEKIIENGRYNPSNGSLYEKTIYKREKKGNTIKAIKRNSSDEIKSYWTYKYDSNDNLIEVKTYNAKNVLTQIQSNKYDKNKNNIEMISSSPNSSGGWRYIYKYNDKKEKTEQLRYKPDGSLKDRRTYSYDKNGNEDLQIKFNPDGGFTKFISKYDKNNNLTVQDWFNEKGEKTHRTSFEYVYDKNGNWITRKRSSNGILGMIWERQIEYHK